jgi:hypothetical protein
MYVSCKCVICMFVCMYVCMRVCIEATQGQRDECRERHRDNVTQGQRDGYVLECVSGCVCVCIYIYVGILCFESEVFNFLFSNFSFK